jgi:hypothetical protein
MIQVHQELKTICNHHFQGHPAVAPVITLHVFKARVTNTAFEKLSGALKSIEKKLADTQKNFDKLHDKLSKLEKKNLTLNQMNLCFHLENERAVTHLNLLLMRNTVSLHRPYVLRTRGIDRALY